MISDWFKKLSELFGASPPPSAKPATSVPSPVARAKGNPPAPKPTAPKPATAQRPAAKSPPSSASPMAPKTATTGRASGYMLVVGLDFGTAYTKVVVRDALVTDPGKAYPIRFQLPDRATCFLPSLVFNHGGTLLSAFESAPAEADRIDYLKMRLVAEVEHARASAWLDDPRPCSIQVTVAWFLSRVLAEVGERMREIWTDYGEHPEDYCFINICVPIAHSDGSPVEACLLDALYAARAAVGPLGTTVPSPDTLAALLADPDSLRLQADFCYGYPETSSNLQSYLKSRSRKPGLYLLLDVGAGTVDLTFFRILEDEGDEAPLRYYHAAVLDAGSSRLELLTVSRAPSIPLLEALAFKEGRFRSPSPALVSAFAAAQKLIHDEVGRGVGDGVAVTESKLHPERRRQLELMKDVRLIFSGGGFVENPYEKASRFFQQARQWLHSAPVDKLADPADLDWSAIGETIPFRRISVAYGLSFPRYALENHRFPSQVGPNRVGHSRETPEPPTAPTKDDC